MTDLTGVRVAVQANISVRGWRTDAGSRALAGFSALEDATVVTRLKEAGAQLCGPTRTSEFGLGLDASEAGEAVRRGDADIELVVDSAGEGRLAAAGAGIYALKPSWGLVSRFGLVGLIPSMESCSLLSASPGIIRKVLDVVAGPDDLDFSLPAEELPAFSTETFDPASTTIGFVREAASGLPAEQAEAFQSSLDLLGQLGFPVRETSLPDFGLFPLVHEIVGSVEASSAAGRYDSVRYGPRAPGAKNWNDMYLQSRGMAFGTSLKSYLIEGAFFQFEHYSAFEDACRIRRRLVQGMETLTAEVDFIAMPLLAGQASLRRLYEDFSTGLFANMTGQPALSLPRLAGARDAAGPAGEARGAGAGGAAGAASAGLQLTGPRLSDARLLSLAELLLGSMKGDLA